MGPLGVFCISVLVLLLAAGMVTIPGNISAARPRREYLVSIDAGSSGSRVYVYAWQPSEPLSTIQELHRYKIKPGVSSYSPDGDAAGASLQPLLKRAESYIPGKDWANTSISLQATAGMRLLDPADTEPVMQGIRKHLAASRFSFDPANAEIVPGTKEARYIFTSVNTGLNTIAAGDPSAYVGTLDLGGGSTQIAFPTTDDAAADTVRYTPCFGPGNCTDVAAVTLYGVSRLHFGINEMFADFLASDATKDGTSPCLFKDQTVATRDGREVSGTGDFAQCLIDVAAFVAVQEEAFDYNPRAAQQPALPLDREFYATDHLPKFTIPLLAHAGVVPADTQMHSTGLEPVHAIAKTVCEYEYPHVQETFKKLDKAYVPKLCFAPAYFTALLDLYGFPADFPLTYALSINGQDGNWVMGSVVERIGCVHV